MPSTRYWQRPITPVWSRGVRDAASTCPSCTDGRVVTETDPTARVHDPVNLDGSQVPPALCPHYHRYRGRGRRPAVHGGAPCRDWTPCGTWWAATPATATGRL